MPRFGSFEPLCTSMASAWCNLFMRQIIENTPLVLQPPSIPIQAAPVGVNPTCGINRLGQLREPLNITNTAKSLGNIANIVACGISFFVVIFLILRTSKRKAAVGRAEFRIFLIVYLISVIFNLLTTGSIFQQGSLHLTVLTAIHAGIVAALFWALLGNAIVATQVVEDGTPSSLIPFGAIGLAFFGATLYIALDVALTISRKLGPSNPPLDLMSIPLFILTQIWPGVAVLIYFILMIYVVLGLLREVRPVWNFVAALVLFVLSQLAFFLLSRVVCDRTNGVIDGSFIATTLETASVVQLFVAWKSITEESWDDDDYYRR